MILAMHNETYQFEALVERQVLKTRYLLSDVFNLTLDRPFRYHLWIDTKQDNPFRRNDTIRFDATIMLYRKRSGKCRFGLTDIRNIDILD